VSDLKNWLMKKFGCWSFLVWCVWGSAFSCAM